MSAISTLGVETLSLRGANSEYNRFSRFFRTRAEAQAAINSSDWTPEAGVANACLTADEGVLYWDADSSVLVNADDATRTYINTQITNLVGDAPGVLDQLSELADALGDDANFVTTVNTKIDTDISTERARAVLAEDTLTADLATEVTRATAAEAANAASIAGIQDGYDFTGKITAPATDNVIPFLFADQAAFPTAADVHGAVAHSHADGAIYFAHAGAWHKLANDVDVIANATDLATETNRAVTAEAALDVRLDTLEADPTTATAVAAVQADVDQNETDADAADAALSARLDTLEADPTTKTYVDTQVSGLIDAAPGALDTLNELAAAMGDDANFATTVTNQIAVVQADVDQNETDADAAEAALGVRIDNVESEIDTARTNLYTALGTAAESATAMGTFTGSTLSDNTTVRALLQELESSTEARLPLAGGTLIGSLVVRRDFPDLQLRSNQEKRVLFTDDGGAGTAAIKNVNSSMTFFAGGIAGGNLEMTVATDGVDVSALKIAGTAVTATATELNYVDGVTSNIQTQLDSIQADVDQNESDADTAIALKANIASPTFTGTPAAPTASAGANTTQLATTAFVSTAVANLVDGAPGAIDTLNELAAALGDDANFSTTITNSIAAVQADVDQNETDSDAAEAALSGRLDTLEADPTTKAYVDGTTTAEATARTAADDAIDTRIDNVESEIDTARTNLYTALGQSEAAQNMGTFTGSTLSDNTTVRALLQELETDTESRLSRLGGTLTGNLTLRKSDGSAVALVMSRQDHADMSCEWKVTPSYVSADKECLTVTANGQPVAHFDERQRFAINKTDPDYTLDVSGDGKFSTNLIVGGTLTLGSTAITATGTELNYVDGVTSNVQTQLDAIQADVDQNESDADTAIAANETHIDNMATLTGVAKDATNVGTFTGSTISDNGTIKAGIQELETAVETKLSAETITMTAFKAVVAASSDFGDFQSRVAAL